MKRLLMIALAIILITEYAWTKRTKIAKQINICFAILFRVAGTRTLRGFLLNVLDKFGLLL